MSVIKVLIVDDSTFMRQIFRNIVDSQLDMKVVGIARDGLDAVEKAKNLKPDVITLDIDMPKMSGSEALKIIMENTPTKVIVVSSFTSKDAEITMECLSYGAFDFIQKPTGNTIASSQTIEREFLEKIRASANVDVESLIPRKNKPVSFGSAIRNVPSVSISKPSNLTSQRSTPSRARLSSSEKILLIASSTGGPRSLEKVVPLLPSKIGCPGIIVQHMPAGFTKSLADRLNKTSNVTVKEAADGEVLNNDTIYIAPGNYHLGLKNVGGQTQFFLDSSDKINNIRPAADFTFDIAADMYGKNIVCVVLTGMGKDGAQGATKIKHGGGKVIAESENTSVVYGMPKAVVDYGAADFILDNTKIAQKIISLL